MAVDTTALKDGLVDLFSNPPSGGSAVEAAAQAWSDVMVAYAGDVVPASTTVSAAGSALKTALQSAFVLAPAPTVLVDMETAFAAFAATVGAGMAPAFTATPPPNPVGFAALGAPPFPSDTNSAAEIWKTRIDTWFKTGTATPSGGGSPVNWS